MENEQKIFNRLMRKRPGEGWRIVSLIAFAGAALLLVWSVYHAAPKPFLATVTDFRSSKATEYQERLDDDSEVLTGLASIATVSLAFVIGSFALTMLFEGNRAGVVTTVALAALIGIVALATLVAGHNDAFAVYGLPAAVFVAIGTATGGAVANK